jgi:16S rRNA (cytosine1402-N4)-methyltransferase
MDRLQHYPVLYHEIIHALQPKSPGIYVDGTVGAGGHARGILEACAPDGRLLGIDIDPQALMLARENLAPYGQRAHLAQASYSALTDLLQDLGWGPIDGLVLDLGLSSMQLDAPERGFSFQHDAPLDMRFDQNIPTRAADLVNLLRQDELADLIYRYGEERFSRQIAKAIVKARPIRTTGQLVTVIETAKPARRRIHPATQTFQALRIEVNKELDHLKEVLPQAVANLKTGGRMAVISFHSLEDRIIKEFFRRENLDCLCPPKQPICTCGHKATLKEVTKKPIAPGKEEIKTNPRARSAKLRIAEKK